MRLWNERRLKMQLQNILWRTQWIIHFCPFFPLFFSDCDWKESLCLKNRQGKPEWNTQKRWLILASSPKRPRVKNQNERRRPKGKDTGQNLPSVARLQWEGILQRLLEYCFEQRIGTPLHPLYRKWWMCWEQPTLALTSTPEMHSKTCKF
jgi:hypothetical protein